MAFLEHLVDGDKSLEGLDLVGQDRLDLEASPKGLGGLVIPGVDDAAPDMFALGGGFLGARGLLDVDGQLGLGPEQEARVSLALTRSLVAREVGGKQISRVREEARGI